MLGFAGGFNFKIGLAVEPDEVVVVLLAGSTFLFFLGGHFLPQVCQGMWQVCKV